MKPEQNAIIRIPQEDRSLQVRPAAFVFETPDGAAWVEPSYLDPAPASAPAFHRLTGKLVQQGGRAWLESATGTVLATIDPVEHPGHDDAEGSCTRALMAYSDALVEAGISQADERLHLERQLADDLA